jgi:hypothetical protein
LFLRGREPGACAGEGKAIAMSPRRIKPEVNIRAFGGFISAQLLLPLLYRINERNVLLNRRNMLLNPAPRRRCEVNGGTGVKGG